MASAKALVVCVSGSGLEEVRVEELASPESGLLGGAELCLVAHFWELIADRRLLAVDDLMRIIAIEEIEMGCVDERFETGVATACLVVSHCLLGCFAGSANVARTLWVRTAYVA